MIELKPYLVDVAVKMAVWIMVFCVSQQET